ncbi:MAG: hypothetical protein ACOC56_02525 [Atribacterota bacterium]
MATDIVFPLYEVLVENIFGGMGLAIVGIAIIMMLILFLCRTSWTFLVYWMSFYFIVMATMYIGALGLVLFFILVTMYAIVALVKLITPLLGF